MCFWGDSPDQKIIILEASSHHFSFQFYFTQFLPKLQIDCISVFSIENEVNNKKCQTLNPAKPYRKRSILINSIWQSFEILIAEITLCIIRLKDDFDLQLSIYQIAMSNDELLRKALYAFVTLATALSTLSTTMSNAIQSLQSGLTTVSTATQQVSSIALEIEQSLKNSSEQSKRNVVQPQSLPNSPKKVEFKIGNSDPSFGIGFNSPIQKQREKPEKSKSQKLQEVQAIHYGHKVQAINDGHKVQAINDVHKVEAKHQSPKVQDFDNSEKKVKPYVFSPFRIGNYRPGDQKSKIKIFSKQEIKQLRLKRVPLPIREDSQLGHTDAQLQVMYLQRKEKDQKLPFPVLQETVQLYISNIRKKERTYEGTYGKIWSLE